jgi:hypothetical protein
MIKNKKKSIKVVSGRTKNKINKKRNSQKEKNQ